MENLRVMNSKEKKNILKLLYDQFGFQSAMEYEFLINTRNKIFILSRDFAKIETRELRINSLGLYFGEIYNGELRLSIEGSQIIGKLSKKNILELSDEDARRWMGGEDFEVREKMSGFVIIKNNDDFLGCGKLANGKLYNYVPKERRQNSI